MLELQHTSRYRTLRDKSAVPAYIRLIMHPASTPMRWNPDRSPFGPRTTILTDLSPTAAAPGSRHGRQCGIHPQLPVPGKVCILLAHRTTLYLHGCVTVSPIETPFSRSQFNSERICGIESTVVPKYATYGEEIHRRRSSRCLIRSWECEGRTHSCQETLIMLLHVLLR